MSPRQRRRKAVVELGYAPIAEPPTSSPPTASDVARRPARPVRTAPPSSPPVRQAPTELLTPRELAGRLKIDPATVYRMTRKNALPYISVNGRARYDFVDVIAKLRNGSGNGSGE